MAVIMTKCPETGREISTEIECDRDTFRDLPFVVAQVVCPHCECEHLWSKSDAWLEDCRLRGTDRPSLPAPERPGNQL